MQLDKVFLSTYSLLDICQNDLLKVVSSHLSYICLIVGIQVNENKLGAKLLYS